MKIVYSVNDVPIRLTNERWEHIIHRHPELLNCKDWILDTVQNPELILEGDFGELQAIKFYIHTPLTSKYLVVAYKELHRFDGFIVTSYFSNRYSERRKIVWKK